MTQTTSKQVPGLSTEDATQIRAGLVWLESAPYWAEDKAWESFCSWCDNATSATECFSAASATDDGFLWQDEDDNEWEHLCC